MPASHRSARTYPDRPLRVTYCPEPSYPRGLAAYGFTGHVILRFVVDTLGIPELDALVVYEFSNQGFVPAVRRVVAKCRFRPAQKAGQPVRVLVQQRVVFRFRDPKAGS